MNPLEMDADPSSRNQPLLPAATRDQVATDAPELLPLLDLSPSMLIYTKTSQHFEGVWLGPNCRYRGATSRPRAIVCPRTEAEVALALRLASGLSLVAAAPELSAGSGSGSGTSRMLPLAIRGGGHDSFGRSTIAGPGILLDTRHLDSIRLDPHKKTVQVGAGVIARQLSPFLASHGLFTPMGYCSTVGYTGWCLGGGFGVYTAGYGSGAEGIVGARLVTADGRIIDVDEARNKELFWAIRGAGNGNFGVVLELRVRVYPQPRVLAGWLGFPSSEAEQVVGGFGDLVERDNAPDEFNGDIIWAPVSGLGAVVSFMFVWTPDQALDSRQDQEKSLQRGWEYLARLKELGSVVIDSVAETTPAEFLSVLDATFKDFSGAPFYVRSPTVAANSHKLGRVIAQRPVLSTGHVVGGTHFVHGSRVERHNPDVALPSRRHVTITLFGAAETRHADDGPEMGAVRDWVDGFVADVERAGIALPPSYVSFSPSESVDLDLFYGEENADRLRVLKQRYDPENLFGLAYPTIKPRGY